MKMFTFYKPFFICCFLFLTSCTTTPEQYFDRAVLNSNMLVGFAEEGMFRELESPSAKMDEKGKVVAMKRSEVVEDKIKFIEDAFGRVAELKETVDTKEMLEASKALYAYILPVYKDEYVKLAGLYDAGAPKEQIRSMTESIHDKYYRGFQERYNTLIGVGKLYAKQHSIKVNWGKE